MHPFTTPRSRSRADGPTARATPRRVAAGLVALVTLAACGVVGTPTAATAEGGLVPDINPQQSLQDAPELKGYDIDTSALTLGVVGISAKNQQYKHTGALGYHHSWFPNKTPTQQSFLTVGNDVQHVDTTTVTQTHTVSGKVTVGVKAETKVDFFLASEKLETSLAVEVGYAYSNQQTSTVTNATTVKVPSTPVVVLPGHVAEVTQYVDEGTFSADLDVTGQLAGDVVLKRCGKTVQVPIGQLAALRRDPGQGSLLPTWMTPDGDTVKVKTTARWSSQLATQQIIDVKDSVISGPQAKAAPTQKATAKPVAVPYVSPVTGAPTKSATTTKRSATPRSAATSLRDLITCDASKVVVSTPSTNLSLPALPNGLTVTNAAISQQGGDIHAYVLASDKKVYHSRRSGSADFGAWKVEQGAGHTVVSALTLSGGAVYSDGATVYASYGGAFGPLPAGVRVAEVRSTGEAGPFVRGTDGILYRWVSKENAWKPLPGSGITAMAASEEDEALAYTDGSVVRYWSSTRGFFSLPALPAGVGVKKLQASAQSGDAYVYALGSDGRVYKTGLRAGGPSFSGWAQLAGAGIIDLSAATSGGGGGEYTDGRTVYATWGGTLPPLPAGVTATSVVLGAAADHRTYTYVLAADGRVYRIASDAKSWETLPMTGVHGIFLSQTDATLLSSVD